MQGRAAATLVLGSTETHVASLAFTVLLEAFTY